MSSRVVNVSVGLFVVLVCLATASGSQSARPPLSINARNVPSNNTQNIAINPTFVRPGKRTAEDIIRQYKTKDPLRGGAVKDPRSLPSTSSQKERDSDPLLQAEYIADTRLPTDKGHFRMRAYRVLGADSYGGAYSNTLAMEPMVIYAADKPPFGADGRLRENVPVRIHDQCLTSEVFRSRRCDCKEQLKLAMDYVQQHGGAVIYLQQEGRGIGLANKVAAYELQDLGLDTVDANLQLGFPDDARQYGVLPSIFSHMKVRSIRLMTNNPRKVHRLSALGIKIVDTIPILAHPNEDNRKYLETKQDRMAHTNFGHILANEDLPAHGITNGQPQQQAKQQQYWGHQRASMTPRRSTARSGPSSSTYGQQ